MSAQEEAECIPEVELVELFRPRRTEPEKFREGVERRIEELREQEKAARAVSISSWRRRVASIFPGDIFVGAAGGSAAGKVVAVKLLPAALALPVLLLGSAFGAFAAGVRSLKHSKTSAIPVDPNANWSPRGPQPNRETRIGSAFHKLAGWGIALGVLAAPLAGRRAIDLTLLVILCSMAALVISMRGFASAGLLTRPQVARLCTAVLYSTFLAAFWCAVGPSGLLDSNSELGTGWSVSAVLGGAALCTLMAHRTRWEYIRVLVAGVLLTVATNPFGWTRSSPQALRAQLASMQLDLGSRYSRWDGAAALNRALQMTGSALPDLSGVRSRLSAAIDSGVDFDEIDMAEPLQMGLIDAAHRKRLCERPAVRTRLNEVRAATKPLHYLRFEQFLVALLKDDALGDPTLRARLADQLEAEWPEPGRFGPLEDAWLCVRGLDEIGAKARADALRDRAHGLLVSSWISDNAEFLGEPGGFTPDPVKSRSSRTDDTWYAVQLMARFGAPPEIDLGLLRGYLRIKSRVVMFDVRSDREAIPRASLRVLEDEIGMPERTTLQRILDERLLIASLLLVALCLVAIRLAPSPDSPDGKGAQP